VSDDDGPVFDSQAAVVDLGAAHDSFLEKLYLGDIPPRAPLPTRHPSRASRRACSGRPDVLPRPSALSGSTCTFRALQVIHFYTQMTIAFAAQVVIFLPGREGFFDKASWFCSQGDLPCVSYTPSAPALVLATSGSNKLVSWSCVQSSAKA
jgi:hypothetical protein